MILPRTSPNSKSCTAAAASVQGNVVYGGSLITLLPIKGKIPGDRSADLRLPDAGCAQRQSADRVARDHREARSFAARHPVPHNLHETL